MFYSTIDLNFSNMPAGSVVMFPDIGRQEGDWALDHGPSRADGTNLGTEYPMIAIVRV